MRFYRSARPSRSTMCCTPEPLCSQFVNLLASIRRAAYHAHLALQGAPDTQRNTFVMRSPFVLTANVRPPCEHRSFEQMRRDKHRCAASAATIHRRAPTAKLPLPSSPCAQRASAAGHERAPQATASCCHRHVRLDGRPDQKQRVPLTEAQVSPYNPEALTPQPTLSLKPSYHLVP